jgi:NitT/TauT family transport system permease protein
MKTETPDRVQPADESGPALTPSPARRSSPLLSRLAKVGSHLAFVVLLLLAWEVVSGTVFDEFYVSNPLAVWNVLVEWSTTPTFWDDLLTTLWETALGFAIGAGAGTVVAFVLGESRGPRNFFNPYINALYGVPKSALAPLFIVWFGVGLTPKVVLSASLVFFLVFYNTLTGLLSVDRGLLNVVKLGGASRWQVWTTLKIPAAFPYWITGAKVALPISLIGAIIGEFISSNRGMGYRILQAGNTFATAQVFAVLIVLSVVSLLMISALSRVENHFLRWRLSSE